MPSTPATPPTPPEGTPPTPPTPPPATPVTATEPKNWWECMSGWGKALLVAVILFVVALMINATNQPKPITYNYTVVASEGQVPSGTEIDKTITTSSTQSPPTLKKVDLVTLYNDIMTKSSTLERVIKNGESCRAAYPNQNVCLESALKKDAEALEEKTKIYNVAVKSDEETRAKYDLPKQLDAAGKPV